MAYYEPDGLTLYQGDCRDVMASLPECSVDAIVTDPPYELGFMGKGWDGSGVAYDIATWTAALRVLRPGGHMVAFGAPRNYHRMTCAIEDAGFEIRDCLMWLFGSGFPKSLDISKAIDKAAGAEREIIAARRGVTKTFNVGAIESVGPRQPITNPATVEAQQWQGWGTALKPAYEPIVLARKPLKGTVASNVQEWGTGGLNIDATRIGSAGGPAGAGSIRPGVPNSGPLGNGHLNGSRGEPVDGLGRWPANVLLDEEAARLLDAQSGELISGSFNGHRNEDEFSSVYGDFRGTEPRDVTNGSRGGASRFFYTAKTSRAEREFGLDDIEPARRNDGREKAIENPRLRTNERRNDHPTVKPVDLMRWLCRLITPPNGLILDPFLGSGSTGMAALDGGFRFIGIDLEAHYLDIAQRRIARRHLLDKIPDIETQEGKQGVMF